jgi:predicted nucleic acid-binding protein
MIIYCDTSALVKRYFQEAGTESVQKIFERAKIITISQIGFIETISAFYRKQRSEPVSSRKFNSLIRNFKKDWESLHTIVLRDQIFVKAEQLIMKYFLRSYDAIHLTSAVIVQSELKTQLHFIASDIHLLKAAQSEGFRILNPETDPSF